jgi:hypothetical protein
MRSREISSGFGGEVFADPADGVALVIVQRQKLEAVAQALAVADNGTNLDRIGRQGQRDIESDDFARLEAARKGGTDAVLTHFSGPSPAAAEFSDLKHFDLQADIDCKARKAAGVLSLWAMAGAGWSARLCGGCCAGFIVGAHFR